MLSKNASLNLRTTVRAASVCHLSGSLANGRHVLRRCGVQGVGNVLQCSHRIIGVYGISTGESQESCGLNECFGDRLHDASVRGGLTSLRQPPLDTTDLRRPPQFGRESSLTTRSQTACRNARLRNSVSRLFGAERNGVSKTDRVRRHLWPTRNHRRYPAIVRRSAVKLAVSFDSLHCI